MDDIERVKKRFNFTLPKDYLTIFAAGVLNDDSAGLNMSRFWWLTPKDIAEISWFDFKIKELVPCAKTPAADHYCWYPCSSDHPWIADCPGLGYAEGYAPHFEGFVFRSLLEEFADCWRIKNLDEMSITCKTYAERVKELIRSEWAKLLYYYASGQPKVTETGSLQVVSWEEVYNVVKAELAFPMLGKEFEQYTSLE